MIAAVHAEWFDDLGAGAYTVALDGGKGEAYVIEGWVHSEREAWVYAAMHGILAAMEAKPDTYPGDLWVIGDRGDLGQLLRAEWPGKLGDALGIVHERWPGVGARCKSFVDRRTLRRVLRQLVEESRNKDT